MDTDIFTPHKLVTDKTVSEKYTTEIKEKHVLFSDDNCDKFLETLGDKVYDIDFLEDKLNCKLKSKKTYVLGKYYPKEKRIKYYSQTPGILEITKIHERFHAIHHQAINAKGNIWEEFSSVSSFFKELLAQLFTYIYIRDDNKSLLPNFIKLNKNQPLLYKTYKIFNHFSKEQAVNLYWIIRNKNNLDKIYISLKYIENKFTHNDMTLYSKINSHLVEVLTFICKNPTIFVSETDIHQLVMNKLMNIDELNPYKLLFDTNCTIGTSSKKIASKKKVVSPKKYKTMLMHKEYGHESSPYSRSDIVILNPDDVNKIDDPINLKYKKNWLTPDYIFEFGTEKSAGSKKDFEEHLEGDLKKVAKASKQGYIIHIHRNYYISTGKLKENNEDKFREYLASYKKAIDNFSKGKNNSIFSKIKIIIVLIDIGGVGREVRGKVRLIKNPYYGTFKFSRINLDDVNKELSKLLKL